jgi:hypothetical protein
MKNSPSMTGAFVLMLIALPCCSQTPTTGKAETNGACSPAISGSNNQVNLNCKRLPPLEKTVKLAVMIPFDTAPKSMPIPVDENPDDPLFRTYGNFQSLAMSGTVPDDIRNVEGDSQISWEARPVSINEAPEFLARMLQYYVFQTIDSLQRDSLTVFVGYPAQASAGIEPPDAEPYAYDRLARDIGENAFFKPFRYRQSGDEMTWKMKPVRMPKKTEIQFLMDSDGYILRLRRRGYYTAEFSVKEFVGTGIGSVPKYFATSHAATTMQWTFILTMRYSIEQSDDNSFNPTTYAQWLDSLFDGLRKRLVLA